MKSTSRLFLWSAFVSALLLPETRAQDLSTAETSVGIELRSAYVYHGVTYNDGMVIQPFLDVAKKGFGLNVWANFDVDDYNNTLEDGECSEVDLTASYSFALAGLDCSIGYVEYLFPYLSDVDLGLESARELYVDLSRKLVGNLGANVKVQYDLDVARDYYARLSLDYGEEISSSLSCKLKISAACVGRDKSPTGKEGLHDYEAAVSLSYKLTDTVSLDANVAYADTLDKDVLPEEAVDVNVHGGIGLFVDL